MPNQKKIKESVSPCPQTTYDDSGGPARCKPLPSKDLGAIGGKPAPPATR